jgi:alkanesulfonate monooxygenase SsuD/methylene tetrahydromethanopterin reductase-like flavin-dependent oxidoreductase (luciferase family)
MGVRWVAARTERIRVAPNVLNTVMRSPAIVAKPAASLDLLSGGRVELGVGRWVLSGRHGLDGGRTSHA